MTDKKSKYPNNLLRLIKNAGLNQASFARKMGWSYEDVNRKGHGHNSITPPQLKEIYTVMGWTATQVYGEDAEAKINPPTSEIEKKVVDSREQLQSAIKLWFRDEKNKSDPSILALASFAYRGLEGVDPDPTWPIERIIISCLISLQTQDLVLNKIEMSFLFWVSTNNPKLFGDTLRRYFSRFIPADDIAKVGKLSKAQFFEQIGGDYVGN